MWECVCVKSEWEREEREKETIDIQNNNQNQTNKLGCVSLECFCQTIVTSNSD